MSESIVTLPTIESSQAKPFVFAGTMFTVHGCVDGVTIVAQPRGLLHVLPPPPRGFLPLPYPLTTVDSPPGGSPTAWVFER
jgi:hypothetical protein